jgi:type I restriction enzyme S subunit
MTLINNPNRNVPFDYLDIDSSRISEPSTNPENRFDARFFSKEGIAARLILRNLEEDGVEIKHLKDFADEIYWPNRFKRKYVNASVEEGIPFLTPSELFKFPPQETKFIVDPPDDIEIEEGWILITRSGSIGRSLIATRLHTQFAISDDLIRFIPSSDNVSGYIQAFIKTWVGQSLILKNMYGMTVKHIEANHIAEINIPVIPDLFSEINQSMMHAHNIRFDAQEKLLQAEQLLTEKVGLPRLKMPIKDYLYFDDREIEVFIGGEFDHNLRLDASYYRPIVQKALHYMNSHEHKGDGHTSQLRNLSTNFVPGRFKRPYVEDPEIGVPLLQGSHITQIKPQGIKPVWDQWSDIEDYRVKEDWILVTCSGTIGNLSLVSRYSHNWTATNHVLRIVPDTEKIHPGYLTTFLLSTYGQVQFQRLSYGGVVDEIGEAGDLFEDIIVYQPSDETIEKEIGDLAKEAYQERDEANIIEDEAITKLENALEKYL